MAKVRSIVIVIAVVLSGCSISAPVHETPGWDDLVADVQEDLSLVEPEPLPSPIEYDPVDPYLDLTRSSPNAVETNHEDLTVGQCFLYPYDENENLTEVVQVVPCKEPHYGEVYATGEFTTAAYSDDFDGMVWSACEDEFESYIGIDYWSSNLFIDYSYISELGWEQGLRGWRCYVIEADNENSGSVRGSAR